AVVGAVCGATVRVVVGIEVAAGTGGVGGAAVALLVDVDGMGDVGGEPADLPGQVQPVAHRHHVQGAADQAAGRGREVHFRVVHGGGGRHPAFGLLCRRRGGRRLRRRGGAGGEAEHAGGKEQGADPGHHGSPVVYGGGLAQPVNATAARGAMR